MRSSAVWCAAIFAACGRDDGTDGTGAGPGTVQADADSDGFFAPVDCDDGDADVHPGAVERCNTVDDDCNGGVDDDAVDGDPGFVDSDGDGVGNPAFPLVSCSIPGWAPISGDCDDADPTRSPNLPDLCNGLDDDCDFALDNDVTNGLAWYDSIQEAILDAADGVVLTVCPDASILEGGIVVDRVVTITGAPASSIVDGSSVDTAVFVVDGGDLTLDGLTVRGGRGALVSVLEVGTVRAGGGVNAIVGAGGPVTVRNTVFDHNNAGAGGAIAATTLTVADSTFTSNTVSDEGSGGALWIGPGGSLTVDRSELADNTAFLGGAIFTWSNAVLTDVDGHDNTAVNSGGFAFVETSASESTQTRMDLVATDVYDNTALEGGALKLWLASGGADEGTTIHDNVADECGGLTLHSAGFINPVTWSGGDISSHTLSAVGGGGGGLCLDASDGGTIEVTGVDVHDNTAGHGGAISAFVAFLLSASVTVRDSVLVDNRADFGGAIWASGIAGDFDLPTVVLENVDITGNLATDSGGGIAFESARASLTDVTVTGNKAVTGGGMSLEPESIVDVVGSSFSGNVPNDVGFGDAPEIGINLPDVGGSASCVGADATCL